MRSIMFGRSQATACMAALALLALAGSGPARAQSSCQAQLQEVARLAKQVNDIKDEGEWAKSCDENDVRILRRMIRIQTQLVPLSRRYAQCDRSHEAKFTRTFAKNLAEYRERLAGCE